MDAYNTYLHCEYTVCKGKFKISLFTCNLFGCFTKYWSLQKNIIIPRILIYEYILQYNVNIFCWYRIVKLY